MLNLLKVDSRALWRKTFVCGRCHYERREPGKDHCSWYDSVVSTKVLVEGPIDKKSTFLFSARRSYLNLLKSGAIIDQARKVGDTYYLFDLNGKLNYRLNKK
ncbi:MAG: hypothetical protein WDO15_19535 [Bacteroidota bacterium]